MHAARGGYLMVTVRRQVAAAEPPVPHPRTRLYSGAPRTWSVDAVAALGLVSAPSELACSITLAVVSTLSTS